MMLVIVNIGFAIRIKVPLAPKIFLASGGTFQPAGEYAASDVWRPVVCVFDVMGDDSTSGAFLDDPSAAVQDDVGDYASNKPVSNGVGEWHELLGMSVLHFE